MFGAPSGEEAALVAQLAALDPVRVVEAVTSRGVGDAETTHAGRRRRGARGPTVARADTVTQWNLNATTALMVTAGQARSCQSHMAMVHGAVATPSTRSTAATRSYLPRRASATSDSKEAAAATAAYRVLLSLVPTQQATLDAQYAASSLAESRTGPQGAGSRSAGHRSSGDDRGADGRRPLRRVPIRGRLAAGPVAAGAACLRQRSGRVAEGRAPVPDRERYAVPLGRPEPAVEPGTFAQVQRG